MFIPFHNLMNILWGQAICIVRSLHFGIYQKQKLHMTSDKPLVQVWFLWLLEFAIIQSMYWRHPSHSNNYYLHRFLHETINAVPKMHPHDISFLETLGYLLYLIATIHWVRYHRLEDHWVVFAFSDFSCIVVLHRKWRFHCQMLNMNDQILAMVHFHLLVFSYPIYCQLYGWMIFTYLH